MIDCGFFYDELTRRGVGFWTGTPDSLLKNLCAYITDNAGEDAHIIAVNEGAAVGLAAGFHLAAGKIPCVYMQNSGIGNAVNPLLSLADKDVYRIPILLIVGWRGEPGVKDEPQHKAQGRVTPALFAAMDIPHTILALDETTAKTQLDEAFKTIRETNAPYALIIRKDSFAPYALKKKTKHEAEMSREEAIETILLSAGEDAVVFCTTGMASRELYELREKRGQGHTRDFLTVGSMGHTASIALGFALQRPDRRVICIDGDGAALMHLGALAQIAARSPSNLTHIALNNAAHDSVGGQPTIAGQVSLSDTARAVGYKRVQKVNTQAALAAAVSGRDGSDGGFPYFIEVLVKRGARADLGRPKEKPEENKKAFMDFTAKD